MLFNPIIDEAMEDALEGSHDVVGIVLGNGEVCDLDHPNNFVSLFESSGRVQRTSYYACPNCFKSTPANGTNCNISILRVSKLSSLEFVRAVTVNC